MNVAALLRNVPRLRSYAALAHVRGLATRPPPPSSGQSNPTDAGDANQSQSSGPGPSSSSEPSSEGLRQSQSQTQTQHQQTALSLDFSPEVDRQDEPSQRTGARSSKDSLSSIERKRRAMGRATLALMGLGAIAGTLYLGREWEPSELAAKKMVSGRVQVPAKRS